jgi:hypothetical protein
MQSPARELGRHVECRVLLEHAALELAAPAKDHAPTEVWSFAVNGKYYRGTGRTRGRRRPLRPPHVGAVAA